MLLHILGPLEACWKRCAVGLFLIALLQSICRQGGVDDYPNNEARCLAITLAGSCSASCAASSALLLSIASIAADTPESVAASACTCLQHVMIHTWLNVAIFKGESKSLLSYQQLAHPQAR